MPGVVEHRHTPLDRVDEAEGWGIARGHPEAHQTARQASAKLAFAATPDVAIEKDVAVDPAVVEQLDVAAGVGRVVVGEPAPLPELQGEAAGADVDRCRKIGPGLVVVDLEDEPVLLARGPQAGAVEAQRLL